MNPCIDIRLRHINIINTYTHRYYRRQNIRHGPSLRDTAYIMNIQIAYLPTWLCTLVDTSLYVRDDVMMTSTNSEFCSQRLRELWILSTNKQWTMLTATQGVMNIVNKQTLSREACQVVPNRDERFGPKEGQISPKWEKSGIFQIRFQYICAHWSGKILDLSHLWPIWPTLDPNVTSLVPKTH